MMPLKANIAFGCVPVVGNNTGDLGGIYHTCQPWLLDHKHYVILSPIIQGLCLQISFISPSAALFVQRRNGRRHAAVRNQLPIFVR